MRTLHINLVCQDGTFITAYRPYDYLSSIGVSLLDVVTAHGKLTHIAQLTVSRALTAAELVRIAELCNQEKITQTS